MQLNNAGVGGGDHAEISFVFTNTKYVPDDEETPGQPLRTLIHCVGGNAAREKARESRRERLRAAKAR